MKRNYSFGDPRLLEHVGKMREGLVVDLEDFKSFDADLNEALIKRMGNIYNVTLAEGGDDVVLGRVGVKTQALLQQMTQANEMVKDIKYYAEKAYPKGDANLRRFHFATYYKVKNNQAKLIKYLSELANVVDTLRAPLKKVKAPDSLLDSIAPMAQAVEKANAVQENSKGGRLHDTQERIERLNELYSICKQFNNAADRVYKTNPAKREVYRLPSNSSTNSNGSETEVDDSFDDD